MPAHIWSDHVRFRTPRLLESPGAIALLFISHFFSSGFFLFPPSFPLPDTWFRHIYTSRVPVTLPTFQTKKKNPSLTECSLVKRHHALFRAIRGAHFQIHHAPVPHRDGVKRDIGKIQVHAVTAAPAFVP